MRVGDKFGVVGTQSTATIVQINKKRNNAVIEVVNPLREGRARKMYLPVSLADLEDTDKFVSLSFSYAEYRR